MSPPQHWAYVSLHPPFQSPVGDPQLRPLDDDVVVVDVVDDEVVVVVLDDVMEVVVGLEDVVEVVDDVVMPVVSDSPTARTRRWNRLRHCSMSL